MHNSELQSNAAFLYVIGKSDMLCDWHIKENTISNFHYSCTHIIEIPTNKRAISYKLKISRIGNCKTESIIVL